MKRNGIFNVLGADSTCCAVEPPSPFGCSTIGALAERCRLIQLAPQRIELAAVEDHISKILFVYDLDIGEAVKSLCRQPVSAKLPMRKDEHVCLYPLVVAELTMERQLGNALFLDFNN